MSTEITNKKTKRASYTYGRVWSFISNDDDEEDEDEEDEEDEEGKDEDQFQVVDPRTSP